MERRTVLAATVAAGMCLAAGAFTVSAVADPPPAAHVAQVQPAATEAVPVVHQVTTIDRVVVVTTVPVDAVRAIHVEPAGSAVSAAQPTLGGAP